MKKYRVICYPNVDRIEKIVEAESVEEACNIAEALANLDTGFTALPNDVEEIKEEKNGYK